MALTGNWLSPVAHALADAQTGPSSSYSASSGLLSGRADTRRAQSQTGGDVTLKYVGLRPQRRRILLSKCHSEEKRGRKPLSCWKTAYATLAETSAASIDGRQPDKYEVRSIPSFASFDHI